MNTNLETTMDSAIPPHLQCPRTQPRRTPADYQPPYPSGVARYPASTRQVVMAYFGVQYPEDASSMAADTALRCIAAALEEEQGPGHWERARYLDAAGYVNVVSTGYWDDPGAYAQWFARHGAAWAGGAFGGEAIGTFTEVLQPTVERFETLFSSGTPEGVACISAGLSEPVQEHAYWGGMRDRLAVAQNHDLAPADTPTVLTNGLHQRVMPQENLCLIRSGQDWTATQTEQRRIYLEDVEPVLRAGMDYLRDDGRAIGCFANRYMTVLDAAGHPTDKSFGMGWWKSLAALERWAESHPTHVAIFGAAMKYLSAFGPAAQLKLYHEVTVAAATQQYFEYFNCHPQTGMLRAAGC